jgi:DNA-binding transcriptional regulator YdaS (Cro superfamily)
MPKVRLDKAIAALRRKAQLGPIACQLELSKQATSKWTRVPAERVLQVAEITGLTPHFLRPDLYPKGFEITGRKTRRKTAALSTSG